MHELALMESLVQAVSEHVGDQRVAIVRVEVGQLTAVVPEALRFCFDVCARGTCMDGAELEIIEIPGWATCRACGAAAAVGGALLLCSQCGGADVDVTSGQELRLKNLEVI